MVMWPSSPAMAGYTHNNIGIDRRSEYEYERQGSPGPDVPLNSVTRGLRRASVVGGVVGSVGTPTTTGQQQQIWLQHSMSSPTSSGEYPPAKRRRMSPHGYDQNHYSPTSGNPVNQGGSSSQLMGALPGGQPVILQQAIPKRGARACTACRKGKNRCEGDVSLSTWLCFGGPDRPAHRPHHM